MGEEDVRAVICPHAGYRYSGTIAALGFKQLPLHVYALLVIATELTCIHRRRVFVLGPSHHFYSKKCMLPHASTCETPIRDLEVDIASTIIIVE